MVAPLISLALLLTFAVVMTSAIFETPGEVRDAELDLSHTYYAQLTLNPYDAAAFELLLEGLSADPRVLDAAVASGAPFMPKTSFTGTNAQGPRVGRIISMAGDYFGALLALRDRLALRDC